MATGLIGCGARYLAFPLRRSRWLEIQAIFESVRRYPRPRVPAPPPAWINEDGASVPQAIESCSLFGCNRLIGWAGVIAMAYVPGFEWDIFINYPMEAEDWAKRFDADLKKELAFFLPGLEIYFAKRNWELGLNSNVMLEQARKSCLFLAILTRGSVAQSDDRFLSKEWEAFRESGSVIGRFIPLSLKKITSQEILKVMPIGNDGSFHNSNARFFVEEDGVEITLRPDSNPQRAALYHDEVAKVAGHIAKRLDEVRLQRGSLNATETKGPFSGKTVLLGQKEPRIENEWNEIHTLLRHDGVTILPATGYPDEPAQFGKAIAADLSKVDLFVQLLSPGDEWEYQSTDKISRAKLEFNAAKSAKHVPILQWCKPFKRERLDQLDPELFGAPSLMVVGLEEFKNAIREKFKELTEAPRITSKVAEKPYLYITADTPDWNHALDLQESATQDTIALVMSEEKEKRQSDFAETVAIAKAVIFLYGESDPGFVAGWLNEYAKLRIKLTKLPKIAALYRAPPKKPRKLNNPFGKDMLRDVGSEEEFSLDAIQKICAELRGDLA
jgi:hypothetical protein